MKQHARLLLILALSAYINSASAHGGGLDSYGCHHDKKAGLYHCHQGTFKGRTFSSQAEMLKELQKI